MGNKTKLKGITRAAAFIALLIIMQAASAALGNTIVTGTIVNMLLVTSVMTCGLASGLAVAAVSPVIAKLLGIGPFWSLIPFIVAGNAVMALIWHKVGNMRAARKYAAYIAALLCAAASKFLVLYIGIVNIAVPIFLNLPEKQAAVISSMFSTPQLITALAGGALAALLLPRLKSITEGGRAQN